MTTLYSIFKDLKLYYKNFILQENNQIKTNFVIPLIWLKRTKSSINVFEDMLIEIKTERGIPISRGIKSINKGTATKDSPKPNVEWTSVATKLTTKMYI